MNDVITVFSLLISIEFMIMCMKYDPRNLLFTMKHKIKLGIEWLYSQKDKTSKR